MFDCLTRCLLQALVLYMYAYNNNHTREGGVSLPENSKLYSLELDVRSYERLRRDEKILVDFSEFLSNLVWLLEQSSLNSRHIQDTTSSSSSSWRLEKEKEQQHAATTPTTSSTCGGTDKRFRMVIQEHQCKLEFLECNAFRELSHLKLSIQSNSDKGTAKFLSFRLHEVLEENQCLGHKVERLEQEGRQMHQELSGLQERMSADTHQHSNESSTWKLQCDMLQSQIINAKEKHEFLKGKLEAATAAEVSATRALSSKELDLERATEEIQRLRARIESFERSKVSLEEVQRSSEKEMDTLKGLCDGYKSARDMADARVEDWKRIAASHETKSNKRAESIRHMEKRLSRLSQELSDARAKSHDVEKRNQQREELMETQEHALRSAQSRVSDLQQQHRHLEQQLGMLQCFSGMTCTFHDLLLLL